MKRWPVVLVGLMLVGMAGTLLFSSGLQGQSSSAPAVPKDLVSYRDVVKSVLPAVVSIRALPKATPVKREKASQPRSRPQMEDIPGLPPEFRKFFEGLDTPRFEIDPEDLVPQ